jgi:hypothetical protein
VCTPCVIVSLACYVTESTPSSFLGL